MRDAVLSLALSEAFPRDLLHWRTSRAHVYAGSRLNATPDADGAFEAGPGLGAPVRNVRLPPGDYLLDRLGCGAGFHVFAFTDAEAPDAAQAAALAAAQALPFPVVRVVIGPRAAADARALVIADPDGRVAARYGARARTGYALRPDLHEGGRWRAVTAEALVRALEQAAQALPQGASP
jgi:3-(3-hydroxy-phenyl)propionate hydroxylase